MTPLRLGSVLRPFVLTTVSVAGLALAPAKLSLVSPVRDLTSEDGSAVSRARPTDAAILSSRSTCKAAGPLVLSRVLPALVAANLNSGAWERDPSAVNDVLRRPTAVAVSRDSSVPRR